MEDTEKQESADLIRAQLSPVLSFDEIRQVELGTVCCLFPLLFSNHIRIGLFWAQILFITKVW
jgi:hypothetical protein